MPHALHLTRARNALKPRREPYWSVPIAEGLHIGFRCTAPRAGTWIARLHDKADGKHKYRALGVASKAFSFEKARDAALAWMRDREAGVSDLPPTVADACREYVADLRDGRRESAAHDAEQRFKRTVYAAQLGRTRLDKLRTQRIKEWRNGLDGARSSQNRNLTALKAALNLAVRHRRVNPAAAQEWRDVSPHKAAGKRRDLFLDLRQRGALLKACEGNVRGLVEGVILTGARAGELVNATRSQFDARTGSMRFHGKTGERPVPLSPDALALFKRLAKGKLPKAPLFTRDDGKPWAHSDWDVPVRDAARKAKLPRGVCLYTLRHSFITEALRGGMVTLDVARIVGTSITMIEKHYGQFVAEAARERLAQVKML